MLNSFIFSVNAIAPICFIVCLGMFLKKIGIISDAFCNEADKVVFKVALPITLFTSIYESDLDNLFDRESIEIIIFGIVGVTLCFLLLCFTVPFFIKDNRSRGAFIQGVFRSNYAIFGIPLAYNMFGEAGKISAAVLLPWAVLLFNVYAVITFVIFAPKDKKMPLKTVVSKIACSVVTNPLIIGIVLGLVFAFLRTHVPFFELSKAITSTLNDLGNLAIPLALLSIGAEFRFDSLKNKIGMAFTAALMKVGLVPLIAITVGALMGYRNIELTQLLVLFGSPTAVSSYIMAKNMDSDHVLASQILLLAVVLSLPVLFLFIFVLRSIGML